MQPKENPVDKTRVFVVHGRNEDLRKSMFDFLRSIGLKPIEWSQAIQMTGNASPFIGDVLDAAFGQAQAVVVLLIGDDEARLRPEYHSEKMPDYERNLTPQARPNVIFEAGLALGRFPTRTLIVEVGDLRPFSDIAGRHTIRLNNSTKTRQDFAQRLKSAGCNVDLSGTDWHHSGNFEPIKDNGSKEDNNNPSNKSEVIDNIEEFQIKILQRLAGFNEVLVLDFLGDSRINLKNTKKDFDFLCYQLKSLEQSGYITRKPYIPSGVFANRLAEARQTSIGGIVGEDSICISSKGREFILKGGFDWL